MDQWKDRKTGGLHAARGTRVSDPCIVVSMETGNHDNRGVTHSRKDIHIIVYCTVQEDTV